VLIASLRLQRLQPSNPAWLWALVTFQAGSESSSIAHPAHFRHGLWDLANMRIMAKHVPLMPSTKADHLAVSACRTNGLCSAVARTAPCSLGWCFQYFDQALIHPPAADQLAS
jgi:hypothetical protein